VKPSAVTGRRRKSSGKDAQRMALMTWTDSMSVGVKVLDEDHKKLVGMVNELHDGILEGHRHEALAHVLDQLVQYTKVHFAREEQFFAKTQYAQAAEHKKEHDDLIVKAGELQSRYKGGSTSMLSLETMSFLKSWLSHHIQGSDKLYTKHLNSSGIH
jgi:hemerythrin